MVPILSGNYFLLVILHNKNRWNNFSHVKYYPRTKVKLLPESFLDV